MPSTNGDLYQGARAAVPGASPSSTMACPQTRPRNSDKGFGLSKMVAMAMATAPAQNPMIAPHWFSWRSLRNEITCCLYRIQVPNEKAVQALSPQNPAPRPAFRQNMPTMNVTKIGTLKNENSVWK